LSASETNRLIDKELKVTFEEKLLHCFREFMGTLQSDFPPTEILASQARNCYMKSSRQTRNDVIHQPDDALTKWLEAEYQLFKTIENDRYNERIKKPFSTVEELVEFANTILNRRKSRAGKSLEHHLAEIFTTFQISFSSQGITEGNNKPDFIFPNIDAYHSQSFNTEKLTFLASKTTCKDRWRQVLNEADRIKEKHLFTLQQGISKNQLAEMIRYNVKLVIPKNYLTSFPVEYREKIFTLEDFIRFIKGKSA
jgi:hypothetical protein